MVHISQIREADKEVLMFRFFVDVRTATVGTTCPQCERGVLATRALSKTFSPRPSDRACSQIRALRACNALPEVEIGEIVQVRVLSKEPNGRAGL